MIITIDGPSGTGKTTIAKGVAERLGIPYFDTGAMYRAVAFVALRNKVDLKDENQIDALLKDFSFRIEKSGSELRYFVADEDVTERLRDQAINAIVSEVAAFQKVREALWALQRAFGKKHSAVFEGRDMGSVVFPKAEVKIFLTATPKERARRRLEEMRQKQPIEAKKFDQATMEQELDRRDRFDSNRPLAPLKCPKGAYIIDTTSMSIDQIIEEIHAKTRKYPGWFHSKSMNWLFRIVLASVWSFLRLLYRHRVYGLEHYYEGSAIIAPNHSSYLDPPIVATSWPSEVHFLAKEELFNPPVFGPFIRALNSHPVRGDATDIAVFKTILKLLEEGKKVILFPEGGRTDKVLGPIKPGIVMLLSRSKSAVIPTYIHGADTIWGINRKLPKLWGKTACIFGTPILWERFASMEKKEAQKAFAKTLSEAILGLKSWYDAGAKGTPP